MGQFPEAPENAKDDDLVIAKFIDGDEKEIPDMAWGRLSEIKKGGMRKNGQGAIWEGEAKITKNRIKVGQRPDRKLLMSIWEQDKQRLNVTIEDFGEIPPDENEVKKMLDNDHPTVKKAAEYVVDMAKKYAKGELKDVAALKMKNYENYEKVTGKKIRIPKEIQDLIGKFAKGVKRKKNEGAARPLKRRTKAKTEDEKNGEAKGIQKKKPQQKIKAARTRVKIEEGEEPEKSIAGKVRKIQSLRMLREQRAEVKSEVKEEKVKKPKKEKIEVKQEYDKTTTDERRIPNAPLGGKKKDSC